MSASFLKKPPASARRPSNDNKAQPKKPSALLKFALEMGPLLLFFFANSRPALFHPFVSLFVPAELLSGENAGLYSATLVLMFAAVLALAVSYWVTRKIAIMPLVTALLVLSFGALSLYLHDPSFIKMKPTILYVLFSLALFGGLYFNKPLLPIMFDQSIALTETGWRLLTLRWGAFFLALAVLNELVWRTQSNDVWVAFKFPGILIIIFVFTLTQIPLIKKHELTPAEAETAPEHF